MRAGLCLFFRSGFEELAYSAALTAFILKYRRHSNPLLLLTQRLFGPVGTGVIPYVWCLTISETLLKSITLVGGSKYAVGRGGGVVPDMEKKRTGHWAPVRPFGGGGMK